MTYEQLYIKFNNTFSAPTLQDAETRCFTVLTDMLRGMPIAGFGTLVLQAFEEELLEDHNYRIYAHKEFVLAPDAALVAYCNGGASPFPSITTDVQRVAWIIADSLAKGEEVALEGYGIFTTTKMAAYNDGGFFPAKKYPMFIRDSSHYRIPSAATPEIDQAVFPEPQETIGGVRQWRFKYNGGWQTPYRGCLPRPTFPTAAEFNAAVQANVAAQLGAATAPLNAQITALNAQIAALQAGNPQLIAMENAGTILVPKRRTGAHNLNDFTVLNAVYRTGNNFFNKRDLDFVNVQMQGVQQAVRKFNHVATAKLNDLNTTAIYRRRANRLEEYSAKIDADFVEFLTESVRIMNFCVDEIRFRQYFNLNAPTLVRTIEPNQSRR